jgi:NAD(P)-dependent dehydrogenase (short-subunit alcohol dehydrogenase family)
MTAAAALVTGGSAGIGQAICAALLQAGHHVVALDRRPAVIAHPALETVAVDLTDLDATAEAAAEIARKFAVTTLVHNAGAMRPALLPDVEIGDLQALVNLHLGAALILLQAVLPSMRQQGSGRVVLVSSRAALGLATRTAYSATKAGMIGMARTWALELGPIGITVNVVAPGPIETDMFHEVIPAGSPQVAAIAQSIPRRRIGRPQDVARAVMFFAAPENDFVTGQVLYVCGGTSIGSLVL